MNDNIDSKLISTLNEDDGRVEVDFIDPSQLSPGLNIPRANIVADDQEELNFDRHHLANLR